MAVTWKWPFNKLIMTIVATLLNRYDFFCAIEGITGGGKSTLALQIALKVKAEFRKLLKLDYETVSKYYEFLSFAQKGISEEEFVNELVELKNQKAYGFKFNTHIVYKRSSLIKFLDGWKGIAISDEAVNTMFNRDFTDEDQKNIVKILNMMRDHNNLIIACIPNFKVLDNQIRDLCKMRLSIVRRGVAVIQTPNRTFYSKDKWDTANNEKIEREWLVKKSKRPRYAKLTTFRGLVKFPKLAPDIEKKYQIVKDKKRTQVVQEEMGYDMKAEETPEDILYRRLLEGGIKNMQVIEGAALAQDMTSEKLKSKIRRRLELDGKATALTTYFWGKKKAEDAEIKGFDWNK